MNYVLLRSDRLCWPLWQLKIRAAQMRFFKISVRSSDIRQVNLWRS